MLIARLRAPPRVGVTERWGQMRQTTAEVRLDEGKAASSGASEAGNPAIWLQRGWLRSNFVEVAPMKPKITPNGPGIRGMSAEYLPCDSSLRELWLTH
jgi:hypothetical protein